MDNLSLFKDFGLGDDMDFFSVSATKTAKKEQKKAADREKKKAPKKESSSTDAAITLPVDVLGRNFSVEVDAESNVSCLSQLRDYLIGLEYEELKIPEMGLFYSSENHKVYVVERNLVPVDQSRQVFESEEDQILVCDGLVKAVFTPEDFNNMEYDHVTANVVAAKWAEINTAYSGCRLAWDGASLYYPVFEERNVANEKLCYLMENGFQKDFCNLEKPEFAGAYLAECQKNVPVTLKLSGSGNYLFLSYEKDEGSYFVDNKKSSGAAAKKKTEEVYKLPFRLHIVTWNMDYELTSDMFGGKEAVTKEEIKKGMADRERMFADNSRKVDMMFSAEHNTMSVMFLSGSKGAASYREDDYEENHVGPVKLIRSLQELEAVKKLDFFLGVVADTHSFKIMALPHGNFYGYFGKELECCTVKRVVFERKLPLIPRRILDEIIGYFRKDLTKESCVRILYNRTTGEFTVVEAQGKRTKVSIEYDFSAASDLMRIPGMLTVMEIHSHNTMDAYFSSVDDEDEQYPGVFGVIGHLEMEQPQMKFRARLDGVSSEPISVTDLFERY